MARRFSSRLPRIVLLCSVVLFLGALCPQASACEGLDVGQALSQLDRDVHSLCVVANGGDAEAHATFERLKTWCEAEAGELNVTVERLTADDTGVFWEDYGLPSAPPDLPVTVFVARHTAGRRAFVVDHWEPGPTPEELANLLDSPLRKAIRTDVPLSRAVLLYAPSTGEHPDAYKEMLEGIVKAWAEKEEDVALALLERPAPDERALMAFAGIPESGPTWLGVIAGCGKLLFPPMKGEDITEMAVSQILDLLIQPCTCIADPASLGVDLPMKWGEFEQSLVSALAAPAYSETVVGDAETPPPEIEIPVENPPILLVSMAVLGGLALLAVGVVVLGLWRRQRRQATPLE
jgi:hypothetical protein